MQARALMSIASRIRKCAMKALLFLLTFTPLAAASEVKTLKLATGEVLVAAFKGGVPLPAESKWTVVRGAGPAFVPEGQQFRLNWTVDLTPKGSLAQLRDIVRVTVQEVSGAAAVQLFDGPPSPPKATDTSLLIMAPAHVVSREHYPWLYTSEPTLLVFRVTLHKAAEQDLLLQPVLVGADVKQRLKAAGVVR